MVTKGGRGRRGINWETGSHVWFDAPWGAYKGVAFPLLRKLLFQDLTTYTHLYGQMCEHPIETSSGDICTWWPRIELWRRGGFHRAQPRRCHSLTSTMTEYSALVSLSSLILSSG